MVLLHFFSSIKSAWHIFLLCFVVLWTHKDSASVWKRNWLLLLLLLQCLWISTFVFPTSERLKKFPLQECEISSSYWLPSTKTSYSGGRRVLVIASAPSSVCGMPTSQTAKSSLEDSGTRKKSHNTNTDEINHQNATSISYFGESQWWWTLRYPLFLQSSSLYSQHFHLNPKSWTKILTGNPKSDYRRGWLCELQNA